MDEDLVEAVGFLAGLVFPYLCEYTFVISLRRIVFLCVIFGFCALLRMDFGFVFAIAAHEEMTYQFKRHHDHLRALLRLWCSPYVHSG